MRLYLDENRLGATLMVSCGGVPSGTGTGSVFLGVRKMSDAAWPICVDLGHCTDKWEYRSRQRKLRADGQHARWQSTAVDVGPPIFMW